MNPVDGGRTDNPKGGKKGERKAKGREMNPGWTE